MQIISFKGGIILRKGILIALVSLGILFLLSFAGSYVVYTKMEHYSDDTTQIMVSETNTEEDRAIAADNPIRNQREIETEEEESETEALTENVDSFYAKEYNGYVAIFNYTNSLYEYTDISVESLDINIKKMIKEGIYFENIEELFAFLESYSS